MKPELEEYFDNFNVMFNSEGFKLLVVELDNRIHDLNDLSNTKDEQDLFHKKGQIAAYEHIKAFPDILALAREQAEEEDVQDF
jgi:hypothetical protein